MVIFEPPEWRIAFQSDSCATRYKHKATDLGISGNLFEQCNSIGIPQRWLSSPHSDRSASASPKSSSTDGCMCRLIRCKSSQMLMRFFLSLPSGTLISLDSLILFSKVPVSIDTAANRWDTSSCNSLAKYLRSSSPADKILPARDCASFSAAIRFDRFKSKLTMIADCTNRAATPVDM